MKTVVMTMVYNEKVNLPIWLDYYGGLFGRQNLYVIDHGSDDGSTSDIGVNRILMPREPLDEGKRLQTVGEHHRFLLQSFDWVIFTDTDEILVPDPNRYASLPDFLDRKYCDVITAVGLNVVHQRHSEPPFDPSRGVLRQRDWVRFHSDECKPLVSRVPLVWDAGFHGSDAAMNLDPDLYLFHLKLMDYDTCLARLDVTRSLDWSETAIRLQHGLQHRLSREAFTNLYFPESMVAAIAADREFEFADELRHLTRRPGRIPRDYAGRFARIPERFRNIF